MPRKNTNHRIKGAMTMAMVALTFAVSAADSPGLIAEFSDLQNNLTKLPNFNAIVPHLVRIVPDIDQPSTMSAWAGLPQAYQDTFAVRIRGTIHIPTTGTWTFHLSSDDGSRLLIDGSVLIDNDGAHGMRTKTGSRKLSAGPHKITQLYFENTSGSGLLLDWQGPGQVRARIPATAFRHAAADLAAAGYTAAPTGQLPGERVGPFRWARKLYDSSLPEPADIAANGAVEHVQLDAASNAWSGVIRTDQWQGGNEGGGRSWSANTLVGDPGKNYFIGMQGWTNVEAVNTGNEWIEVSRMSQDAHVRMAHCALPADRLTVGHGTSFGLDGAFPADAIVLDLSFRRALGSGLSAWQVGYYKGTPVQMGVWQVRAGQTLSQAQADQANRLAHLPVLSEITPDDPFLVKLQVQADGMWQVIIDFDGDGQADVDWTSAMTERGNKPYSLASITDASGLIVTASPAAGVPAGQVGHTRIPIRYVASPTESIVVPRDRRPIKLTTRHASRVSPATIEGGRWTSAHTVTVSPQVGLSQFGNGKFYAHVPLQASGDTPYTVMQSGNPPSMHQGVIQWTVTDLCVGGDFTIRKGDSLLLAACAGYPTGVTTRIDPYGNGQGVRVSSDTTRHAVPYPEVGTYTARSWIDANHNGKEDAGEENGRCTVRVVDFRLPEYIADHVGFMRDLYLPDPPESGVPLSIVSNPDQYLRISEIERQQQAIHLRIQADKNNEPVVEARAGGSDGPLLDARMVATFVLSEPTASVVPVKKRYPDGSVLIEGKLRLTPIRPGLDIRLQIFVSGAAFEDGSLTKWLKSDDFIPDRGSANGSGTISFLIVRSVASPAGPCHSRAVYQAGTKVGQ